MKKRSKITEKIGSIIVGIETFTSQIAAKCDDWITAGEITEVMEGIDSTKSAAEKLVGLLILFVSYSGAVVLVLGIYKYSMSIKDDRPEDKTRAVEMIVVGIFLITIRALLQHIGLLRGRGYNQQIHKEPVR